MAAAAEEAVPVVFDAPDGCVTCFEITERGQLRYSVDGRPRPPVVRVSAQGPGVPTVQLFAARRVGRLDLQHPHLRLELQTEYRSVELPTPFEHLVPGLVDLCKIAGVPHSIPTGMSACGLVNLGNTCYMSGVLQCMSHARTLRDCFLRTSVSGINNVNPLGSGGRMAAAFASLMRDLWSGSFTSVSPAVFREAVLRCDAFSQFADGRQHDPQEFLVGLLDSLHEDLNSKGGERSPSRAPPSGASEAAQAAAALKRFRQSNDSPIDEAFTFQTRSEVVCGGCGERSLTFEPARTLFAHIPPAAEATLEQCLVHERREPLSSRVCAECGAVGAERFTQIASLPRELVVCIKRYVARRRGGDAPQTEKVHTPVHFPLSGLDLHPLLASFARDQQPREDCLYSLRSVLCHEGTLHHGHVTTFARAARGWNLFDDAEVTAVDEGRVRSADSLAYVLFYERCEVDPAAPT
eukprot:TRINITY_DN30947_c0_g1_i1.p1 TRINITY_DN30947_c0_g1~~TRINITY_DN30947_c0_g1_i1.p1  ORF type:complete len:481 (+),score=118.92 TRINITY_DN30947_c0_g1_i1:51-1445(+)